VAQDVRTRTIVYVSTPSRLNALLRTLLVNSLLLAALVSSVPLTSSQAQAETPTPEEMDSGYRPLPVPTRVVDTRDGRWRVTPGDNILLNVGALVQQDPAKIAAVSATITAVDAEGAGWLRAMPCDATVSTSLVNYDDANPRAIHAVVQTNASGLACFTTGDSAAHIIVDVDGWFEYGYGFSPTWPYRAFDSRSSPMATSYTVQVADPGTKAAYVGVVATAPSAPGYLSVHRCDQFPTDTSLVNFLPLRTYANSSLVELSPDGTVCFTASQPTHIVVDVYGYQSVGYRSEPPRRVVDTRRTNQRGYFTQVVVPQSYGAVLSIVIVAPASAGYATIRPCNRPRPPASFINYEAGETVAGAAIISPDGSGKVCIDSSTTVDMIVDYHGGLSGPAL